MDGGTWRVKVHRVEKKSRTTEATKYADKGEDAILICPFTHCFIHLIKQLDVTYSLHS